MAEWEEDIDGKWQLKAVKSAQIDGEKLKADTFYILKDGDFIEAVEDIQDSGGTDGSQYEKLE